MFVTNSKLFRPNTTKIKELENNTFDSEFE